MTMYLIFMVVTVAILSFFAGMAATSTIFMVLFEYDKTSNQTPPPDYKGNPAEDAEGF